MGRRLLVVLTLALAGAIGSGCKQPCFTHEADALELHERLNLPPHLATADPVQPTIPNVPDPATVVDPEREPHYLTLNEAIALALEHGTVGIDSVRVPGAATEDLVSFHGSGVTGSDSVRALALQPAIAGANIEAALARFDALWSTGMFWHATDEPSQGLANFSNGTGAGFRTAIAKPLPTGGVAGISFSTDYTLLSQPPGGPFAVLNPSYFTRLQFGIEQPLLRDFGVDINQVLPALPFSSLFPELNGRRTAEGILVTRLRFDQQRAEFERTVQHQMLNVQVAYWNLYGSYITLYASEQSLRMAHEAWRKSKARLEEGLIEPLALAQTQAQYELFRGERIEAIGRVLDNERTLRLLLGLPIEDGKRLVPIDTPTMAPYLPNWQRALHDTMNLRPELVLAREDLRAKQLNLLAQQNGLRPDLRFQATHTTVGLGSRLDGNGNFVDANGDLVTNNALKSLASSHFNNWTVGLTLAVPLGYRAEHAAVRQARLELARSYEILKDQEMKAQAYLAKQYSQLLEAYKLVESRRLRRQTLAKALEGLQHKVAVVDDRIEFLLDYQRQWAAALSSEYQAIVEYNNALARFEFARGTILQDNNVVIAEGALPACAQVRAVEHERQRARGVVLRERAAGEPNPCDRPRWAFQSPPALPVLWHDAPSLAPEYIPSAPVVVPATMSLQPVATESGPSAALPTSQTQSTSPGGARLGAPTSSP